MVLRKMKPRMYMCPKCGLRAIYNETRWPKSNLELDGHEEEEEERILGFRCPVCGHISPKLWSMKYHFRKRHLNRGLSRCPACGEVYNSPSELVRHIIVMGSICHDEKHLALVFMVTHRSACRRESMRIFEQLFGVRE